MKKLFLNCLDNEVTMNKKNYLLRAAERLGITNVVDIKRREGDEPTDYILNIEPYTFLKGYKWTGVWEIDVLCDRQVMGPNWAFCDDIFIAVSTLPNRLKQGYKNVRLLLQACDKDLHKRNDKIAVDFDMVFATTSGAPYHTKRAELESKLAVRYITGLYGVGVRPEEYVSRLSRAKIQFVRSMNTGIAEGELAQRFFECLAIGPVITNKVKDLEYTNLVEGEDYFAYEDDDEMFRKIDILLTNKELADNMAESGRKKALIHHTYESRLMSIINIAKEYK